MGHRYIEVFRSSLMEAQRAQYGGGYGGGRGGPGPYDRMGGPPIGRGFGPGGPGGARGPRGPMKGGFSNDRGYGGGGYEDDYGYGGLDRGYDDYGYEGSFGSGGFGGGPTASNANHVVHMRGLPFRVTENDIAEWFSSVVDPVEITILY